MKFGSQKGVILAAQILSQISGVLPMLHLHAGLEIGSAIRYAIHREGNKDSQISMPLSVVTIQMGSTIAKMAKSSTLTLG